MSTPPDYFEAMYRDTDDPWHLGERWYEQRKYALTTAALPRARYRSAFEPACSVGALSVLLADRCDRLLSCDRSPRAVASATARLAHHFPRPGRAPATARPVAHGDVRPDHPVRVPLLPGPARRRADPRPGG